MTPARRWLGVGGLVLIGLVVGWGLAADGVMRAYPALDLARVPIPLPAYQPASGAREGWSVVRVRGMSVRVPPGLRHPATAATEPGTVVLTDRQQTTWLSMTPRHGRSRWAARWYRHCLYARRDPLGLLGKALLVPPMGTPTPQLLEQSLGAWQSYLYVAPPRIAADLFDGRHHVTVVYAGRRRPEGVPAGDAAAELETARAIMASLRITP